MGPGWISSPDWCASWVNTYYSGGSAEACALNLQISINRMPLWGGGWISSPNWCVPDSMYIFQVAPPEPVP